MADLFNLDVNDYFNGRIRPHANNIVGFIQDVEIDNIMWLNTIKPQIDASGALDSDYILDGSENDGRTQLTIGEAKLALLALAAIQEAVTVPMLEALVKASVQVKHL